MAGEPSYVENPPWVDGVLNRSWDRIVSKFGEELVPVIAEVRRKRRKFAEFGCGHYGCVLPTSTPGVVFKVTSDPSEAAFVCAAMSMGEWPDGIVRYYSAFAIEGESRSRRPVYVLSREEATNIGGLLNISTAAAAASGVKRSSVSEESAKIRLVTKRLRLFKEWAGEARERVKRLGGMSERMIDELDKLKGWAEDSVSWEDGDGHYALLPRGLRPMQAIAYSVQAADYTAQNMEQEDVGYLIGEALRFYLERGLLLADVHLNNIGQVAKREDRASNPWVITDPGHMVPLSKAWLEVEVPTI